MPDADRDVPARGRPKRLELALVAAGFLVHVVVSFQGIGELFLDGHQGYTGALRAGFARHYLEHGLSGTGGKSLKNPYRLKDPSKGTPHWHHPLAVNILVAGSFALFGESEAAARAVPIAAGLASFWLIYLLVRRRYGPAPALVSCLIFALLPMQVEFGKMVNYEPLVVCFTLAALYALERLRHGGGWPALVGIGVAACLACSTDWPGFLLCAAICIEAVARPPRKPVPALVVGALGLALAALWWQWLDASSGSRSLAWLADFRVGSDTPHGSFETLFDRSAVRLRQYFGWLPMITGAAWVVCEAVRRRRVDPVVAVFLPVTAAYVMVFRQGAGHHTFFLYYLVPAAAVAAGIGVVELTRIAGEVRRRLEPRLGPHLERATRPVVLTLAIGLAWGGAFAVTDYLSLRTVSLISYRVPVDPDKARRGIPYAGRLHHALLGRLLNSMSSPDEVVLMHRRAVDSVQFSYYLWRRVRRVGSVRYLARGRLLVVPERVVDRETQASLAGRYPVVRVLRHLIYDLEGEGSAPSARQLDFEADPSSWWSSWLVSSFYPPHRLVESPESARRYLARLGLAPRSPGG